MPERWQRGPTESPPFAARVQTPASKPQVDDGRRFDLTFGRSNYFRGRDMSKAYAKLGHCNLDHDEEHQCDERFAVLDVKYGCHHCGCHCCRYGHLRGDVWIAELESKCATTIAIHQQARSTVLMKSRVDDFPLFRPHHQGPRVELPAGDQ